MSRLLYKDILSCIIRFFDYAKIDDQFIVEVFTACFGCSYAILRKLWKQSSHFTKEIVNGNDPLFETLRFAIIYDSHSAVVYKCNGTIYRDHDLPSIESTSTKVWYQNGEKHRDRKDPDTGLILPAVEMKNGTKTWWKNGLPHRECKDPKTGLILPAMEWNYGSKLWYKNGKRHRECKDPKTGLVLPATEMPTLKVWYKNGQAHRDCRDPITGLILHAYETQGGSKEWYKNGQRHRDCKDPNTGFLLPAVERSDGSKEWWKNGFRLHVVEKPITQTY